MKRKNCFQALYTERGEQLSANTALIPWEEYPRPQLVRDSYLNLNGWWEFCVCARGGKTPCYEGQIRVPFAPQALLSGVECEIPRRCTLTYRREFSLPDGFSRGRVILHVGASDGETTVVLNHRQIAVYEGGYLPRSLDVTDALLEKNLLEITVQECAGNTRRPFGKQRGQRGGMWYTEVAGIWQTVWLESVPERYVTALRTVQTDAGVKVLAECNNGAISGTVTVHFEQGDRSFSLRDGMAQIPIENPVRWSPERPYLYRYTLCAGEDTVRSYFALRTLEINCVDGIPRLFLNGTPYFFHGLLDQGYFSDGLFTPASPAEYTEDILAAKQMGFNMLRKHIKVEPELFYYECDRLGMIVFQDMVNNGRYSFLRDTALPTVGFKRRDDRRMHRNTDTRATFLTAMEQTVRALAQHPAICYWTIFNEGWGQFDHAAAYARLRELDGTRFIDSVSGWFLPPKGISLQSDVESPHVYFKPIRLEKAEKPLVLSEFGGYSHRVAGHCFNTEKNYGYRNLPDPDAFADALEKLYLDEVLPAIGVGLCGAVYTQLSDVEDETNGLLTYDRRVMKVDAQRMRDIADRLYKGYEK